MIPPTFAVALAVLAAGPSPAPPPVTPAAPAARPLYYERWTENADLWERSLDELRLMRNTIYARAGREFKDPDLRAYFGKQPWYRPTARPAKLSAVDERNLANIKKWEPVAKTIADLRSLVPGWKANAEVPRPGDCLAGLQWDRKQKGRLFALARRLDWSSIVGYEGEVSVAIWARGGRTTEVGLSCAPDLDGDGAPEAILGIRSHDKEQLTGIYDVGVVLLLSRKGPGWRAVAPLGVEAVIPGIEGSRDTNVEVVKLASGKLGLAVDMQSGGGGDCDHTSEKVSVFTLKGGKLIPVATFDISEPACLNEP